MYPRPMPDGSEVIPDSAPRGVEGAPAPTREGAGGFVRAARTVAGLTVLSRVAGLARDAICSRIFGAGPVWSAFALAFMLPNLFRRLFGEGALAAALVPEYATLVRDDPALARRFASAAMGATLTTLAILTLVGEAALFALLRYTPLGESGGLALRLAMVMLPYLIFICAAAAGGGMLQTHDRFGPTAASPILLNLCIIAAASVWGWSLNRSLEEAAFAIAFAVLAAGLLQLGWTLWALRAHVRWTRTLAGAGPALRRMIRRMGPVVVGLGALQLNTLFDGLIAGWPVLVGPTITLPGAGTVAYPLDEASNAVLFFSQRLYQFPLGVFGIALATAVFPTLSRQRDEPARFGQTLRRGVRLSLFIGLPASLGLIAVRRDLAVVILQGGQFGEADTARVAGVLLGYAPAVWAYALTHTLTRAFYAMGDTRTPMRVALGVVAANLTMNVLLIWPLKEAGLAWSTSISAAGQVVALTLLLSRARGEPVFDAQTRRGVGRSAIAAALMSLVLLPVTLGMLAPDPWGASAALLAATVLLGAGVFLGAALLMRSPEPRWLLER